MPVFWFIVYLINVVAAVVVPARMKGREAAIVSWLFMLLIVALFPLYLRVNYPQWEGPGWYSHSAWMIVPCVMLAIGFIIAIRRPRKRDLPVA